MRRLTRRDCGRRGSLLVSIVVFAGVITASFGPQASAQTTPSVPSTATLLNTAFATTSDVMTRINALRATAEYLASGATIVANGYVSFGKSTIDQANMTAINAINTQLGNAYRELANAQATVAGLKTQLDAVAANAATLATGTASAHSSRRSQQPPTRYTARM